MVRHMLAAALFLMAGCATGENPVEAGYFPQTVDETADVDAVLVRAAERDELALIIIGANWCHDSIALMESLESPEAAAVLADKYEMGLVNTGLFARGYETAARFGLPVYTHTPTLLIIDPETEQLVNWDDHYIFRDAYKMEAAEVAAYLTENADPSSWIEQPVTGREEIDQWAEENAARIRAGYDHLASFGDLHAEGAKAAWPPLRDLRYGFGEDYAAALVMLSEGAAPGELPAYDPLPWE